MYEEALLAPLKKDRKTVRREESVVGRSWKRGNHRPREERRQEARSRVNKRRRNIDRRCAKAGHDHRSDLDSADPDVAHGDTRTRSDPADVIANTAPIEGETSC